MRPTGDNYRDSLVDTTASLSLSQSSSTASLTQSHPLTTPTRLRSNHSSFTNALNNPFADQQFAQSTLGSTAGGITRGMRSRKSSAVNEAISAQVGAVDMEGTRPSLRSRALGTRGAERELRDEGKARRSLDELRGRDGVEESREVVVHELVKTDTMASISLQYGITPQALRVSNRLWPSDSIHLRRTLLIPLDVCHLPSSTTIERISREEDGNLIVWEREPPLCTPSSSSSSSQSNGSYLGVPGNGRRAVSAALLESNYDLLGLDSGRSSLDDFREPLAPTLSSAGSRTLKGKGRDMEGRGVSTIESLDFVSSYLSTTNNPYSFSSAPPSPPPPSSHPAFPPSSTSSSSAPSPASSSHSNETQSNPFFNPPPIPSLSRRTLTVSRVAPSSMSFFPPPAPSFSNTNSRRNSDEGATPIASRFSITPTGTPIVSFQPPKKHKVEKKEEESWSKRWDLSYFGAEEPPTPSLDLSEVGHWRSTNQGRKNSS